MSSDIHQLSDSVLDELATILMALADVAAGDYRARVTTRFGEDHPFSALAQGVNEMASSLAEARSRSNEYQRELEEKLKVIEAQSRAIRELSTPVIEVWEGILCLPVVGVVDTVRSSEMTETLLGAVTAKQARCVIIDITGIDVMDTHTADYFMRMAKAVKLLGARCLITGVNPNIASTVVSMGVDLTGVETRRTLQNALQDFVKSRS